jgi:ABC-type phosphate transport system substrate-binding protein
MRLFSSFKYARLFCASLFCIQLFACSNNASSRKQAQETPTHGIIHISVDESFKPVIDSEIKVFESSFPDAKIMVHYKSEADCFRDLAKDSTRMIIVTRGLNKREENFYQDSIHFIPVYGILAYDAIAMVVNNKSKDTILSMRSVQSLLNGTTKNKQIVMDGVSATSTVRYVIDSVLKGQPLGKNVVAAKSSEAVINYVADNENAIGFIGVSWIGDQDDLQQLRFLQKVKIAAVQCTSCLTETYVQPYQANIALSRYPMVRGLYYILKEDFRGIGNNFVNFLQFERGQLIFRRAYLVPARMSFEIRDTKISN